MAKPPDRAMLSRLVVAYDRIAEESLGMGDPDFHEIEGQLFDAIDDSGYRAVIKNGTITPASKIGVGSGASRWPFGLVSCASFLPG
jgi:hypothetical protein